MRWLAALLVLGLGVQQRAELTRPQTVTATRRAYEIVGVSVSMVPTIYTPPNGPTTEPHPTYQWFLSIRYVDNLGIELNDAHNADAERVIKQLFATPSPSPMNVRLLQHLIDEGKIPAARVTR
jgi:hypothetical protein